MADEHGVRRAGRHEPRRGEQLAEVTEGEFAAPPPPAVEPRWKWQRRLLQRQRTGRADPFDDHGPANLGMEGFMLGDGAGAVAGVGAGVVVRIGQWFRRMWIRRRS